MKTLIVKLGATGDVVRTTPLLKRLVGDVTWITAIKNLELLQGAQISRERSKFSGPKAQERRLQSVSWEERLVVAQNEYDLVINLEDDLECSAFVQKLRFNKVFGAYPGSDGGVRYTKDSSGWFDLSLISNFGRQQADLLKFQNRRCYQDLLFEGLGFHFDGETYLLPQPKETGLAGDVAIAPEAGPVWPMKNWAHYAQLKQELERLGLTVNVLPRRDSLLGHLCDVRNHRCLVSGDSLPMHFALGTGTRCVSLFTCTSPWEIHDYGLQTKLVSPLLEQFWYKRGFDVRATMAIDLEEVLKATLEQLKRNTRIHPAKRDQTPDKFQNPMLQPLNDGPRV